MVEERLTDGRRIAELFASEIDARTDGVLARFTVTNADRDVEPTVEGARAYDLVLTTDETSAAGATGEQDASPSTDESVGADPAASGDRIASTFVHPDRIHLEFERGRAVAADAAESVDLRVRPKATTPSKTVVFVESGAAVKRATDVVRAVGEARLATTE